MLRQVDRSVVWFSGAVALAGSVVGFLHHFEISSTLAFFIGKPRFERAMLSSAALFLVLAFGIAILALPVGWYTPKPRRVQPVAPARMHLANIVVGVLFALLLPGALFLVLSTGSALGALAAHALYLGSTAGDTIGLLISLGFAIDLLRFNWFLLFYLRDRLLGNARR